MEIQAALESKLSSQEEEIKRLKEEVERLSFRKNLNLADPTLGVAEERSDTDNLKKSSNDKDDISEIEECTTFSSAVSVQSGKSDMVLDPVD